MWSAFGIPLLAVGTSGAGPDLATARCGGNPAAYEALHGPMLGWLLHRQQLRHLLSVGVTDMAERPEDELAAALVTYQWGRGGEGTSSPI